MPLTTFKDKSRFIQLKMFRYGEPSWIVGAGTYTQTAKSIRLQRTRTGVNNPRWRQEVQDQQNATTPFNGVFETFEAEPGKLYYLASQTMATCDLHGYAYKQYLEGDLAIGFFPVAWWAPSSTSVAYNRGLSSYLKKVRSVQTAFSGPTFIGEFHQTLEMLHHPAQGLRNLCGSWLNTVKHGKAHNVHHWKSNLSSAWLEGVFGWLPFISDVKSAYKAYQSMANTDTQVPVTAYGVQEVYIPSKSGTFAQSAILGAATPRYWVTTKAHDKCVVRFRGMIKRKVSATLSDNADLFGFNAAEFIPTAWELLPWSFLVDYFTNIGDICTSAAADLSTVAWTNVSTIVHQTYETYSSTDTPFNSVSFGCTRIAGGKPATSKNVRRTFVRSTPDTIGFPSLSFEIPGLPKDGDPGSILNPWSNMVALFAQANAIHPQKYAFPPIRR